MDFIDLIKALGEKVSRLKDSIQTEEATKNAFTMPFIAALGYDVFNPMEVVPEFVADLGIKKGEKVDYCIFKDGKPIIIVECKHWKEDLNVHNSQLHRYFHVTTVKFGILTNGIIYRFYTDLAEPNKMDDKPFWEFNITDMSEASIFELKKYQKSAFDVESILSAAAELKYNKEIKRIFSEELSTPSETFVKHFTKQIYSGPVTAKVLDQFTGVVKRALNQYVSELISDRLKSALAKETDMVNQQAKAEEVSLTEPSKAAEQSKILTTEMEKEGFFIVKSILRTKIDTNRLTHRDTQSYFGILIDDNNRKPVCRLHLDGGKKYITLFDENRKEVKTEIKGLDDIYSYSDNLVSTALSYEARK
jgi:predicted type IV restriction endonuclease